MSLNPAHPFNPSTKHCNDQARFAEPTLVASRRGRTETAEG